ncbi:hypothetical protein PF005_g32485 [Phytophthora fragariae]|uniref:Uncharacterized protein n=1 Tax=Phytophthora fragariae TaxID=53985 RepID=A0A6A3G2X4_9STRA|nr:hypothetical protein PF011_g33058 [Phytophthora fragariae]KAE9158350.1 hypothetical protein PF005_g32485 [Phytophthora fragariae]
MRGGPGPPKWQRQIDDYRALTEKRPRELRTHVNVTKEVPECCFHVTTLDFHGCMGVPHLDRLDASRKRSDVLVGEGWKVSLIRGIIH